MNSPFIFCCLLAVLFSGAHAQSQTKPEFVYFSELIDLEISEDTKIGTSVARVTAVDPAGGTVTYSLGSAAAEYLDIDPTTGVISVKASLDFETFPNFAITVVATNDDNGEFEKYISDLSILDANDISPVFSETVKEFSLSENSTVGYVFGDLYVTDEDTKGDIITVKCNPSTKIFREACTVFGVVTTGRSNKFWVGNLRLLQRLDYEKNVTYSVQFKAFDGVYSKTQEIQIRVTNVNDEPPVFVRAQGSTIPEGIPAGTYIDYVSARDTDRENKRPIRYKLYGDSEAVNYFSIEPISGNITNTVFLDYEDRSRRPGEVFTLMVKAQEVLSSNPEVLGDDDRTTATDIVTIRLTDINDNCPLFDKPEYVVDMSEEISQGSNIALQMTVTDKDTEERGEFTLDLGDNTGTFQVTPNTGRGISSVTINVVKSSNIDYESSTKSYTFRVRATQAPGLAFLNCPDSNALVKINVIDFNDVPPTFPKSIYRTSVIENANGGLSLITITANDRDSGKFGKDGLRYSLIGSGQNLFNIDPISGVVTVTSCSTPGKQPCLDYEVKDSYSLSVRVFDNENQPISLSGSTQLIIEILNFNDNSPEFIMSYIRSIKEGMVKTTEPLFIQAFDPDNDLVQYSIPANQNEARLWRIDQVTGEITAIRPIKYRDLPDPIRGTFQFRAMASDGKFDSQADVTISVLDENDNSPICVPSNYRVAIREDIPGGSFVIQVTCSDGDSPTSKNGQVDISIEDSFGKFIHVQNTSDTGLIFADIFTFPDSSFDYLNKKLYTLIVKATDRGTIRNTGTATVIVDIIDINNMNPYFDPPTTSDSVYENEAIGFSVTTVSAKDIDRYNELEITFTDPIRAYDVDNVEVTDRSKFVNLFTIDNKGVVRVNQPMDRDIVSLVTYTLQVQDTNATAQFGTGSLFIRILEFNDQAPRFVQPLYIFNVTEEKVIGSFVGSLLARDEDDEISLYQLAINPFSLFSISTTSGVINVNGRLDYEERENVTLVAQAFDSGFPTQDNTTIVFINIININDNSPNFTQSVVRIQMKEHSSGGGVLARVTATDKDKGDYGVVRYNTSDTNFRVDELTGEIFMKPGTDLDREVKSSYTFRVTAYDSPLDPTVRKKTTLPVYILLDDINDNCPQFRNPSYSGKVIEKASIGDQVVEIFASDKDSGINRRIMFSFDLTQPNSSIINTLFRIQSVQSVLYESGRIEVKNNLRNQVGVYNFVVVASDRGGNNDTGTMCSRRIGVTVEVIESINDSPEIVLPPRANFTVEVLESQYERMLVYDCKAVDVNKGKAGIVDFFFNVQQKLTLTTPEFRINQITGVIRAQVIFDREKVNSYVLTIVAKDQGTPSASSETVLIVDILDVNDNEPEFPMRNGQTIPIEFNIPEGMPAKRFIGRLQATDKDSDHKNNQIFYKIVAGNDEGYFDLDRNGNLSLSAAAANGLDREMREVHTFDVLAYNDVNDDSVIRYRRRRSTNPSIVTVIVRVEDINDTPPKFTSSNYYGCVALNARFGQSILEVGAVDADVNGVVSITYSKVGETTGDYFSVDPRLGTVRNQRLLYDVPSRQPVITIRADDNSNQPNTAGSTADADVRVFVTDASNEVMVQVSQPSADVRFYQDQLIRVMINSSSQANPISFVCVREIRDHVNNDGSRSFTDSDVLLSSVGQDPNGNYFIYSGSALRSLLMEQMKDPKTGDDFRSLYIKTVTIESDEDELSLTEDAVLAIFIIAILLVFLGLILFCLACCLIRNSKKKKIKKLRRVETTNVEVVRQQAPPPEVVTSVNPVYDNKGYQEDEYAVVQKRPAPAPVAPPIVPIVVPADDPQPDIYIPEPIAEQPFEGPEPVIITEPVPDNEVQETVLPASFDPDEPVIETEVMPDSELPEPVLDFPDEDIEVEIRDSPPPSPPRSLSPSPPPSPLTGDDFRIETDVL